MKLHRYSTSLWLAMVAISLFATAGAWAQAGGSAAAASKIGIINVRQAIVSTAEGKQASSALQTQFNPQQADLENLQKQITDLQNRLNNGARTLSDDEKARLQRQGELLARQFQRKQDDLNEAVNAAQADIVDTIGRKMLDVLDRYSRENGFAVVLDTSAQGSPVVYGSSQMDITQEIVKLYDQANPAKGGAAGAGSGAAAAPSRPLTPPASAPATPRPAAPPTTPAPAVPKKP